MTYKVWTPPTPTVDLRTLTDAELKITSNGKSKAIWNLSSIQQALSASQPMVVRFSEKCQLEMKEKLNWGPTDAVQYLKSLGPGRYQGSSWCYAPKGTTPHAADKYVMGFNRFTGAEAQALSPWIFVKFTMIGPNLDKLFLFSAHPEGQFDGGN